MSKKYALIIGNNQYDDNTLPTLKTPVQDAEALATVLRDEHIGVFDDVQILTDENSATVRTAIDDLFSDKKPDDVVLFYFSGHGVLDSRGRLYLATRDTRRKHRLRSTSLEANYVKDWMEDCRSKRQVVILDSCYSGAFIRGSKSGARPVGTELIFKGNGYGRYVLTASDAVQLSYEGDRIIKGEIVNSFFTHFLVEGLRTGAADRNRDGYVDIDELYDYVYEQMAQVTNKQNPRKFTYNEKGNLFLALSRVLPSRVQAEGFDVYAAISDYHRLFDERDLVSALNLLQRIQQSQQAPSRFDITTEMAQVTRLLAQTYAPSQKPQPLLAEHILSPPFAWVKIPAGQVTIEGKILKFKPFAIAKYPLTNAQFAPFIEAGGYREKRWWTEVGWKTGEQGIDWDEEAQEWIPTGQPWTEPRFWQDSQWNGSEQPVVGVSWYEAVAYCRWLSHKTGQKIMLPTEVQWQHAAQGDNGREYPWGNKWDSSYCQNSVGGSWGSDGSTTTVTAYEGKGDSPFDVVDMAGNVWEWCLTQYHSGNNDLNGINVRVLRGGSWSSSITNYFCVLFRDGDNPNVRFDNKGFRVALFL